MSLKISYLDHFVTCCYVIKKATALFEIQHFFDLFELSRKTNQSFSKDSSTKKSLHSCTISFKNSHSSFAKQKKNTPKMQKNVTLAMCHIKSLFLSTI